VLTDQSLQCYLGQVKDKRQQILDTTLALFAREGLAVPTALIAKEAGVANGTLFNYFPTKQELQDTLYSELKTEVGCLLPAGLGGDLEGLFREVWQRYVRWAVAQPTKQKVMHLLKASQSVSPETLARTEDGFRALRELVLQAMEQGRLAPLEPSYFEAVLSALLEVNIEQATAGKLRGKALEAHMETGFRIFWKAVS
jgi:AcrR family transcriptional regulator